MDNELPKRKKLRLQNFDYNSSGAYFITICTQNRKKILCNIVGRDDLGTPFYETQLTNAGKIADKYINAIEKNYKNVFIDKYVIMPNHIHLLLSLVNGEDSRCAESSHPAKISQIIGVLKRLINKEIGKNIFQTSFYDHIIRNRKDYEEHIKYIHENPMYWYCDELYSDDEEYDL